ncbi:MAG TPA: hypothetical protein VFC10_15220 [Terriglobia bacterium]|nr:hypothetical protein [Terriglobia bacterium]
MKKLVSMLFTLPLALCLSVTASAQTAAKQGRHYKERVYYGDISDSNCGAHHKMAGNAHGCTLGCVKNGAKYVFVTGGKVYPIANQNLPDLEKYAGEHVRIMGARTPDGQSITVSTIREAVRRAAKAKAKA